MTYVVTQACCADASCVVACPVNCIHPAPGEPGFADAEMLYIDPDGCVGCGACTTACPVGAIVPDTDLTPDQTPFRQVNADYFAAYPHRDRTPVARLAPPRRVSLVEPLRVAVVGSGPAGMFTADELLQHPGVRVDVYDRLPVPYGLVRHGVAPDHQHTKAVTDLFARIESEPGFGYRLGVDVGTDVSHVQLAECYHAVVYAVGASGSRRLGIDGEQLTGSVSATELTGWYNGHPDQADLAVPLDHERVVVVGNGNVALDVARVLTSDPELLASTDVASYAEAALTQGQVREVVLLGRRGPAEAAFTTPELIGLRGLVARGALEVVVDTGGVPLPADDPTSTLIAELAETGGPGQLDRRTAPRLVLRFHTTATRILGEERVTGVEVRRDGADAVIEAGLVVRSIGFRGVPVLGLPFDAASGTVPHDRGRVAPRSYVVGWIKRGPRGFIGTNRSDARETVASLLADAEAGLLPSPRLPATEHENNGVLGLREWRTVDAEERRRGRAEGRPRVKVTDADELRRIAATERQASPRRGLTARLGRLPRYGSGRSRSTIGV